MAATNTLIDISVPLDAATLPIWPGDPPFVRERFVKMEDGAALNVSRLSSGVHLGTHIDAPYHFVADGATVEQLDLSTLMGTAYVASLPTVDVITAADLAALALPTDTRRLLLHTRNSQHWANANPTFDKQFVAIAPDAAEWLVAQGIALVGIDYLSVQGYHDGPATHQILLRAGVIILEGINLSNVAPGTYELLCLPLKLVGSDGAPARAVLRPLPPA